MDVKKTTNLIILFLIIMFTFVGILTNANNDNKTITEVVTTESPETIKPMVTTTEEEFIGITDYLQDSWDDLKDNIISFSDDGIIDDNEKEKLMNYIKEMDSTVERAYDDDFALYSSYEQLAYKLDHYENNPEAFLRDQGYEDEDYEPLFGY